MLWLVALVYPVLFLCLAFRRLTHPFELEWMEGGTVDHVRRILDGKPLYVHPTLEFVPFIYTPLYYYVCALFAKVLGIGFFPLRLVSFLSSLGCMALIFMLVRRETKSAPGALLAACFYAACFHVGGAWFDVARVDALFMALLLAGVYILRRSERPGAHAAAALLFFLSFLTKQSALVVAAPLGLYCLALRPWPRKLVFPGVLAVAVGLSTVLFNALTGGWYGYYVFDLPRQHPVETLTWKTFWTLDILPWVSFALALLLIYLINAAWRRRWCDLWFFGLALGGMMACGWGSRLHSGGYNNVLLPAYAALAIALGLGLDVLCPGLHFRRPAGAPEAVAPATPKAALFRFSVQALALCGCLYQFSNLRYDAGAQLPLAQDAPAGWDLIARLRQVPGEILMPAHGYLPALAGKNTTAHQQAVYDILRAPASQRYADALRAEYKAALGAGRFGAVIMDTVPAFDFPKTYPEEYQKNYVLKGPALSQGWTLKPVTGVGIRPQWIYERK